jgi:hypothetical protein
MQSPANIIRIGDKLTPRTPQMLKLVRTQQGVNVLGATSSTGLRMASNVPLKV